jgi:hypothetical protein
MAYAFGLLSFDEYMMMLNGAFSGQANLAPVEDYINTQFVPPAALVKKYE